MNRQRALELLGRSKLELQARFGVTRLALFGSTARDTATSGSDVDFLVAFDGPATSKRYCGVQFYLEDLLACPVDLVTEKALRPELRPYIRSGASQCLKAKPHAKTRWREGISPTASPPSRRSNDSTKKISSLKYARTHTLSKPRSDG